MPSTIPPMTVRFSEKTRDGVAHLAKLTNRSRSYIINQAVESYLAERNAYLQDLNEAVESIDTRPTYAADDVFTWMRTWGSEDRQSFADAVPPNSKQK